MSRVVAFLRCACACRLACKICRCTSSSAARLQLQVVIDNDLEDDVLPALEYHFRRMVDTFRENWRMNSTFSSYSVGVIGFFLLIISLFRSRSWRIGWER